MKTYTSGRGVKHFVLFSRLKIGRNASVGFDMMNRGSAR